MVSSLPTPIRTHESPQTLLKRLIAAAGLILLLSIPVVTVTILQRAEGVHRLRPGDPIPALNLLSLDSADVTIISLDGKPGALLFFSVECPRCQQEIANFETLFQTFKDKYMFAGISSGNNQETKMFLSRKGITLPVYLDRAGVGRRFGVDEVPTLFLVRSDGVIDYRGSGAEPLEIRKRLLTNFSDDKGK